MIAFFAFLTILVKYRMIKFSAIVPSSFFLGTFWALPTPSHRRILRKFSVLCEFFSTAFARFAKMNFCWAYRYYIDRLIDESIRQSFGFAIESAPNPVTSPVYLAVFFLCESCAQQNDRSQEQRVYQVLPLYEQHSLWTKICGLHSPPRWFCKLCFHWLRGHDMLALGDVFCE